MTLARLSETKKLSTHLIVSILVSAIPYALVMIFRDLLPGILPDRDQLSAYGHLLALIIFIIRYYRLGDYRKNWIYLPVLAFLGVMFLEESEFLSEISFFGRNLYFQYRPPFVMAYLEKYDLLDTSWRSFHNFFYFIFTQWWREYYDQALIQQIIKSNLMAILLSVVIVAFERFQPKRKDNFRRLAGNFARVLILIGIVSGGMLIPALFTNSGGQGAGINAGQTLLTVFVIVIPIVFGLSVIGKGPTNTWIYERIQSLKDQLRPRVIFLSAITLFSTVIFVLQIAFSRFAIGISQEESRLWINVGAILISIMSLKSLTIFGVNEFFQWPLGKYIKQSKAFLMENPMFIYIFAYSAVMLLAQLFDWHILSREGQRYIREEVIEFASAFQLVLAALMVPSIKKTRKK